jgi:hypothetical protein
MPDVLIENMDARVWAREFVKEFRQGTLPFESADFEAWMISWFASAITTGYDRAKQEERERRETHADL